MKRKELKDIFGRVIKPGDIVAYASSTGFFITVVREITYNRLGKPLRIRLIYPKIRRTNDVSQLVVAGKSMSVHQQELIILDDDLMKNYIGYASFNGVVNATDIVRGLSRSIQLDNGKDVGWVWTGLKVRGYGFYFIDELGVSLVGPYKTYQEMLESWENYAVNL